MKRVLIVIVAVMLLCGFRAPNGNIISKGDLSDKLLINLGEPNVRTDPGLVQTRAFGGIVYIKREVWIHKIEQYSYRFVIENGQITTDHWSQF